jgi:hypothetical protein
VWYKVGVVDAPDGWIPTVSGDRATNAPHADSALRLQ